MLRQISKILAKKNFSGQFFDYREIAKLPVQKPECWMNNFPSIYEVEQKMKTNDLNKAKLQYENDFL